MIPTQASWSETPHGSGARIDPAYRPVREKETKMSKVEDAVDCFRKGFNCAQAVLSVYGTSPELGRKTALKIATPFGAGMARMGQTCGAVTGAFMSIGMKHGRFSRADEASRDRTYELVHEFVRRFTAKHGTVVCKDLIGYDVSIPEQLKKAEDEGVFREICPRFVQDAAEILEELL
jgi:C_GCAxxG_C_C family probable redox protein